MPQRELVNPSIIRILLGVVCYGYNALLVPESFEGLPAAGRPEGICEIRGTESGEGAEGGVVYFGIGGVGEGGGVEDEACERVEM